MFDEGDAGVGEVAAGVDEGNEFGGILFEGVAGKLLAMFEQGVDVLGEGDLAASALKLVGVDVAGFPDDIGGGFGLNAGAVVDGLGPEVILVTAQAPVAEVVLVEVLGGRASVSPHY